MAERPTDPDDPLDTDPAAIRRSMAKTRSALSRELGTLKGRLIGNSPALTHKATTMAPKSSKASPAPAGKKAGTGTTKTKSATSGKAAKAKAAPATATTAKKKSGASSRKPTTGSIMKEAKKVLGDVLAGAATGAVKGAAQAISTEADDVATRAEKPQPKKGSGK